MQSVAYKFLVIFFLLGCAHANSVETIENEQESEHRIPIAIVPFGTSHEIVQNMGLDKLVQSNLIGSGRFYVKNLKFTPDNPLKFKNINFTEWRLIDVDYIIVGSVELVEYEHYRIETELIDIVQEKQIVGTQFLVTGNNIYDTMHIFTDAVLEVLDGKEDSINSRNVNKIASDSSIEEKAKLAANRALEQAKLAELAKTQEAERKKQEKMRLRRIAEEQRRNKAISEFSKYIPAIRNKVEAKWTVLEVPYRLKTTVLVKIDISGEVKSANVTNSSGSEEFDRSVVLAILKASPLPVPLNPEFYNYIKEFQFSFSNPSS